MTKKLTKIEPEKKRYQDLFFVDWSVGNTCNYKCSYCAPILNSGSQRWVTLEKVQEFCEKLFPQIDESREIMFSFTAGETSMWPHLINVCKWLKSQDRNITIQFLSNGSRTLAWWEKAKPHFDRVLLSYHIEFADKDHFLEVIQFLKDEINVAAHMLMKQESFDEILGIANEIYESTGVRVSLQPVMKNLVDQNSTVSDYTEEQMSILENQDYESDHDDYRGRIRYKYDDGSEVIKTCAEVHATKDNHWIKMKCYAGIQQIAINNDGVITRGWCWQGGQIGHINDEELTLPQDPIVCRKQVCNNLADMCCAKEI